MSDPIPPLRPLEAFPGDDDTGSFVLIDPSGLAPHGVTLSPAAFAIVGLRELSGDPAGLAHLYEERFGATLDEPAIVALFDQLDQALLLDSPRFADYLVERRKAFDAEPVRPATLAGECYPEAPQALSVFLDRLMEQAPAPTDDHPPFVVVTPHIDLRVGGELMASAWKSLPDADPELIVILATGHRLTGDFFACIDKPYETPLGPMPTDPAFLDALAARFGEPLYDEAMAHADEHAVEFPALFYTHLFADRPQVRGVPILLSFPEQAWGIDHPRFNGARIDRFVAALRETIETCGKRVTVVASVDFCHVGGRFGDEPPLDVSWLGRLEADDREVAATVCSGDRAAFMKVIRRINPTNRLCGFPPLYVSLGLADRLGGEMLGYKQNVEGENEAVVGFAAMRLWKES